MAVDPINAALETSHAKLNQLLTERAKIDKEIIDWKHLIDSLLAVTESECAEPSNVEVSAFIGNETGSRTIKFTDGVRMVLSQNASRKVPISVPEIRDHLINLGFNFAKYAQPLVPIHNTLKRLKEQGEVIPVENQQGQTLGYRWISPIERALNDDLSFGYGEATGQTLPNIFAERLRAPRKGRIAAIERDKILENIGEIMRRGARKGK